MKKTTMKISVLTLASMLLVGCYDTPDTCCEGNDCAPACEECKNCDDPECPECVACRECPDPCPECQDPECPKCPDCPDSECPECPDCPDCPDCPECFCGCIGGVTKLTVKYLGTADTEAKVKDHWGAVLFHEWLEPNQEFTFTGLRNHNMMGPKIRFYVDCENKCHDPCDLNAEMHTSCSQPIGPGTSDGLFTVIKGLSKYGMWLCVTNP